jgi:hypothetical protein
VEQLLDCSSSSNNSLSLDEKLRWLRQFVPDTLAALPIALPAFASWTLEVKENIAYRIQYFLQFLRAFGIPQIIFVFY